MARLVIVLLLTASVYTLSSYGQGQRAVAPSILPVPPWPADGNVNALPPGRYVFFNPKDAEWVISYPETLGDPQSPRVTLRLGSHAQVTPSIEVHMNRESNGSFSYSYIIVNAATARTPIQGWTLLVPAQDSKLAATHPIWGVHSNTGTPARERPGLVTPTPLVALEWSAIDTARVMPGALVVAFSVTSSYSPGFSTASFRGSVRTGSSEQLTTPLPEAVAEQLRPILTSWDTQVRLTLGPKFALDATKTMIADNFHYGISSLVRQRLLAGDTAFVAGALQALGSFLTSNGTGSLDPERLDFLSQAKAGTEAEIANALRWSLSAAK